MKQFWAILGVVVTVVAVAVAILHFLPAPASVREDFIIEE